MAELLDLDPLPPFRALFVASPKPHAKGSMLALPIAVPRTSGIGASRPLPWSPAKVS
jgi:hypothetical protein